MRDFEADTREATDMLWDRLPIVAEQVEDGTFALQPMSAGRFGVSSMPEASYRVIVDVIEGTVEQDGKVVGA